MKTEYGLMIIWNKARKYENRIIDDVKKRFTIRNVFEIEWNKNIFAENLSRFYGQNLPNNSFKEKHCGNDPFILLILEDKNPIYNYRPTSHGKLKVNVNFFDSKEMYRAFAGQHRIHATNDVSEFKHDLMLLLGLSVEDYEKKYQRSEEIIKIKSDVVGSEGWKNLKEVFYVLNNTINYVVLRNFELLPDEYELGEHSDVDILCDSKENMVNILNGKPYYKNKKRAKYIVRVGNSFINFDVRFIGDNYYDKAWEKNIIANRVLFNSFYIPSAEDFKYSLMYHALIQKNKIAEDYKNKLTIKSENDVTDRVKELKKYMSMKNYKFVYPYDFSVYFNDKYTDKKIDFARYFYFKYYRFIKRIERRV